MKFSNEAKVGILGTFTLGILYLGFNFLKGSDVFSTQNEYYAVYDNVDGLQPSNAITLNGLNVGIVKKIDILQDKGNQLKVTFTVKKDILLTDKSEALLADAGLLGGKKIILNIKPGATLEEDSKMISGIQNGLMKTVGDKASPVLQNADSLILTLNKVVKQFDNTGAVLKLLIANANQTTGGVNAVLASNSKNLSAITGNAATLTSNLNTLAGNLSITEKQIAPILANVNTLTSKTNTLADSVAALQLGRTVNELNQSVASLQLILKEVNAGKGTLGKLTKDQSLYSNLDSTAASLNNLLTDFKANPKRYVHFSLFGGKKK
jgi:phospholipid/cholesterol/gamma-HCH transport system substrate-binding protein